MKKPLSKITVIDQDHYLSSPALASIPSLIERHKGLMTAKQLAPMLGLPLPTLYQWAKEGRIPSFNLAGAIKFDPKNTAAWLRTRAKGQHHKAG